MRRRVVFQIYTSGSQIGQPNSERLTTNPMTISCLWTALAKQIGLRGRRLIRGRRVRGLRSIGWGGACLAEARQERAAARPPPNDPSPRGGGHRAPAIPCLAPRPPLGVGPRHRPRPGRGADRWPATAPSSGGTVGRSGWGTAMRADAFFQLVHDGGRTHVPPPGRRAQATTSATHGHALLFERRRPPFVAEH